MADIDDIIGSLAKKFSGNMLDDETKKPEPVPERTYQAPERREYTTGPSRQGSFADGGKLFPSDKMALRHYSSPVSMPKRPPVLISEFSDDDLEWMLSTAAKRSWEFKDWLEVIGLPTDLHEKHDATIYGFVARAFLKRKQEAHQR